MTIPTPSSSNKLTWGREEYIYTERYYRYHSSEVPAFFDLTATATSYTESKSNSFNLNCIKNIIHFQIKITNNQITNNLEMSRLYNFYKFTSFQLTIIARFRPVLFGFVRFRGKGLPVKESFKQLHRLTERQQSTFNDQCAMLLRRQLTSIQK